ncbi:MAG: PAS domain S-box protein, partial [Acidimicrobiales bacterium]|nr:PAS domain S-box protein [Acidimicrobiales bacterium]
MRHDDSSPPASPDDQPLLAALSQASAAIAGCPDMDLDAQLVAVLDDIGPALGVAAVTVWSASNPSAPLQRMFSWRHEPTAFESDEPGEGTVLVPVAGSDLNHTVVEIETAGVHHAEREYLEILAGVIGQASARRDHAERFNAAFAEASVAMSIRSIEGRLIACNPAYRLLHGLIEEHAAAELPLDLVHEEDRPHVEHARAELLAGRRSSYQLEIRLQTPGGQRWVRTSTSAIRSADGTLRSVLTLLEDVTQQRLTGEVLEHHATHDTLTGLP